MRPLGRSPHGRITDRDSFLTALFDESLHFPRFNEGGGRGQCTEAHFNTLLYCYVDEEAVALQRITGCGQNVLSNFISAIWIFYSIHFRIVQSSDVYGTLLSFSCCFFKSGPRWTWVYCDECEHAYENRAIFRREGNYWCNIRRLHYRTKPLEI